jgi:hypothetical protein
MHRVHQDEKLREELMLDLDEIACQGARRMLAKTLEAEVEFYIDAARGDRDGSGHALVVRNGYAGEREILLGAGAVPVLGVILTSRYVTKRGRSTWQEGRSIYR